MNRILSLAVLVVCLLGVTPSSDAELVMYVATLDEFSEPTLGTGFAQIDYDDTLHTLRVQVTFSDLLGNTTASHIHSPTPAPLTGTAGVATQVPTFTGFPLGVTSGFYDQTFDMTQASSYNASFITANGGTPASAETALASSFAAGTSYLNVHTTSVPGGEIRGFLLPVPEPSTLVLAGVAAVGLLAWGRRRRKTVE